MGRFEIDQDDPWYLKSAPATGGGAERQAIVFRLRPYAVDIGEPKEVASNARAEVPKIEDPRRAREGAAPAPRGGPGDQDSTWDFFISYTQDDRSWAEWVAWQLEDAGYRVLIQAWDFVPGFDWMLGMQQGVTHARRMIALLSVSYLRSVFGGEEWRAARAADPDGFYRKLLPVRIEDCERPGLLRTVVGFDIFDRAPGDARDHLLRQVGHSLSGRAKPATAPEFPVHRRPAPPIGEPAFPPPAEAH